MAYLCLSDLLMGGHPNRGKATIKIDAKPEILALTKPVLRRYRNRSQRVCTTSNQVTEPLQVHLKPLDLSTRPAILRKEFNQLLKKPNYLGATPISPLSTTSLDHLTSSHTQPDTHIPHHAERKRRDRRSVHLPSPSAPPFLPLTV